MKSSSYNGHSFVLSYSKWSCTSHWNLTNYEDIKALFQLTCLFLHQVRETFSTGAAAATALNKLLELWREVGLLRRGRSVSARCFWYIINGTISRGSCSKYLQVVDMRMERLVHVFYNSCSLCRGDSETPSPVHFLGDLNRAVTQCIQKHIFSSSGGL